MALAAISSAACSTAPSKGSSLPSTSSTSGVFAPAPGVVLLFRPVYCTIPLYRPLAGSPSATTSSAAAGTSAATALTPVSAAVCSDNDAASIPTTPPPEDIATNSVVLPVDPRAFGQSKSVFRYVLGPADMTSAAISDATSLAEPGTGAYSVNLTLNNAGAARFDRLAADRFACHQRDPSNPPFCSLEAFEVGGVVESAPTFTTDDQFNGNIAITGDFTGPEAQQLANALKLSAISSQSSSG